MSSRVRVYMACSLDGYIAGPDNDLGFLHAPGPEDSPPAHPDALRYESFMSQVGAMLMGRTTHDVVAAMDIPWPYGDMPVLLATHRELKGAAPTVLAASGSIHELVAQARQIAGDKDVYLDGGALIRQALEAGLVDELCITVLPMLLGAEGTRLFDGLRGSVELEFTSHHSFDNGMVQLTARPRDRA